MPERRATTCVLVVVVVVNFFLHRSKEKPKKTQNKTGPLVFFVVDFLLILSNPGHLAFHPIAIHTMRPPPAPVLFFFFLLYV